MSITIGEPFQLFLGSTWSQKYSDFESACTTCNPSFPGYATVTAKSDGIHVWDLQNLHAVASYSISQHVVFASPALSLGVIEGRNKSVVSYVALRSAPDIAKEHRGRTIWIIRQSLSGPGVATSEKTAAVIDKSPVRIYSTGHDLVPLLFVSKNGSVSVATAQVNVKAELDWPGSREHLETYVFSKESCSFTQDLPDSCSAVAIICCKSGSAMHLRLVSIGEEIISLGTCEILTPNAAFCPDVCGLTCSPCGILSFIDTHGAWATHQLAFVNASLLSSPISENLYLQRFAILDKNASAKNSLSVISLGTSLVLLAALIEGTSDISLQVWDMSYGVILAAQSMPVPSEMRCPCLKLTVADEGQVLLTVTPPKKVPDRPSVHVVPVDGILRSTLAGALGKIAQTVEWLVPKTLTDGPWGKIISDIETALKNGNVQRAEQAFFKWIGSQASTETVLGYELIRRIFKMVLTFDSPTKYPYTPRMIRYLLENAVVSTIVLDGRLITALRQRNDWENLLFAVTTVADISEDELMATAKYILDRQRKSEDAMDVEASEGYVPPLWSYLSVCVSYPFSPVPMRLAIRKHLPDAQDLVAVLEILENWIRGGTEHEVEALLRSFSVGPTMLPSQADCPPYSNVITFLQALLDASFVALLQYQPSHDILHRILSYIEPEISLIDSLQPLCGMLEPFAMTRVLRERMAGSKQTPAEWKRRRKELVQRDDLNVGLYRLEELVL